MRWDPLSDALEGLTDEQRARVRKSMQPRDDRERERLREWQDRDLARPRERMREWLDELQKRYGPPSDALEGWSDEQRKRVRSLQALLESEQQAMWVLFASGDGHGRTVEEAKEYEVSRERIRQIESALAKLRGPEGGGADTAGVREPRRPLPTAGAGNAQIDLDPDN